MKGITKFQQLMDLLENSPINRKVVFLFNSPPDTGKDLICDFLEESFGFEHVRFKTKLFELVKTIYSVSEEEWGYLYDRSRKELPTERLRGLSPRQAMIYVSENVIKPTYGKLYFGEALRDCILYSKNPSNIFCCSDSGFPEEVEPVVETLGDSGVFVVRIHRDGKTYEQYNDSRRYLKKEDFSYDLSFSDVTNDDTIQNFIDETLGVIIDTLKEV